MKPATHYRTRSPLLLADQIVAWSLYRGGNSVADIGASLKRYPTEVRGILHGGVA